MQTVMQLSKRTHWLAGIVAVAATLGSFGAQLTLAEHYAKAAGGAGGSSLASQRLQTTIGQQTETPVKLKTSMKQSSEKSSPERRPAS